MGEPLLAAYLQTLLDKLGPLLNFAHLKEFRSELRTWRSNLLRVMRVLYDAEEKQMSNGVVKEWLDDLRDLSYDADDVLEELRHEALQRQNNSSSSDSAASSTQVQDLLARIKEITTKFSDIEEDKSDLGLEARIGVRSSIITHRLPTTSLVDSSQIVGRKKDVDAILKLLDIGETTKAEENWNPMIEMGGFKSSSIKKHRKLNLPQRTLVIPIVGMGGVGKTTLAQCIYNHSTSEKSFDYKAWAYVSDNFDIIGLTKAILRQVAAGDAIDVDDLNRLQEKLKEKLSLRKFLIVLDDIWHEDYEELEKLFTPFKFGCPGSVVIVTTRSTAVAAITGSTASYPLNLLTDDECLSIFAQHALGAKNFDAHPNLKVIGEKMVRRCGGLPLAAKILGGLLRNQDPVKWEEVCNSSFWNGSISAKISPALRLSFDYLPSHLKRCFMYCSIFSEDHEFDKEELILLWMAEGFLGESNEEQQMEDLGYEYFHDLLSRSLLQHSSHNLTKFVMHNIIHDIAQMVAGRVCFRMEDKEAVHVDIEAVRHLSYHCDIFEPSKKFEVLKNAKRLRTLLALPTQKMDYFHVKNKLLFHNLLPQLRYLRVLSLNSYQIDELPSSVGDLKYLRYLNLSYSHIQFLPESLCDLHSLQSLILKGCTHLQQLPLRLKDLANLRYLDISGTGEIEKVYSSTTVFNNFVSDLKSLRELTKFVVSKLWELGEAKKEHYLPGGLQISMLDRVKDVEDALPINLMKEENIEEPKFEWGRNLDNTENGENLVITGYGDVTLPDCFGDSSYSKLVELSLINCKRCKSLPSLGQLPLLQKLTIKGMLEIETIGTGLYGEASSRVQPFRSLSELHIENCKNLRSLPDGIMSSNSNLQVLEIWDCTSLESFPSGVLPSTLKKLSIRGCRKLESISEMLLVPTSLDHIEFFEYPNLKSLPECLCTYLSYLCIERCESIESFPETGLPSPNLAHLEIRSCENLKYLPSNLPKLISLTYLCVVMCDNLVSLPEQGLPPSLEDLVFGACAKVEKQMWFEWAPHNLRCLTSLSIHGGYRDMVCFPFLAEKSQFLLPPTLASLSIQGFPNLVSLSSSAFQNVTSLAELDILNCPKLQSLPIKALPPSLRLLCIGRCPELKPKCEEGGEYWARLSRLRIKIDGQELGENFGEKRTFQPEIDDRVIS